MIDVTTGTIDTAESRMRIGGMEGVASNVWLAALPVARISYGPYMRAMEVLEQEAWNVLENEATPYLGGFEP
jgi:hypothetical protein